MTTVISRPLEIVPHGERYEFDPLRWPVPDGRADPNGKTHNARNAGPDVAVQADAVERVVEQAGG